MVSVDRATSMNRDEGSAESGRVGRISFGLDTGKGGRKSRPAVKRKNCRLKRPHKKFCRSIREKKVLAGKIFWRTEIASGQDKRGSIQIGTCDWLYARRLI